MPAIPRGVISLWYGSIASIPSGFVLCNGANGTPDLRNKFVPGAGSVYNPGDQGGATIHTHDFTTDGHVHTIPATGAIQSGFGHDTTTTPATDTGTTNAADSRPPYHSLAYIMKT